MLLRPELVKRSYEVFGCPEHDTSVIEDHRMHLLCCMSKPPHTMRETVYGGTLLHFTSVDRDEWRRLLFRCLTAMCQEVDVSCKVASMQRSVEQDFGPALACVTAENRGRIEDALEAASEPGVDQGAVTMVQFAFMTIEVRACAVSARLSGRLCVCCAAVHSPHPPPSQGDMKNTDMLVALLHPDMLERTHSVLAAGVQSEASVERHVAFLRQCMTEPQRPMTYGERCRRFPLPDGVCAEELDALLADLGFGEQRSEAPAEPAELCDVQWGQAECGALPRPGEHVPAMVSVRAG